MEKKANIIALNTKPNDETVGGYWFLNERNYKHIYVVTDEEIKEGDWYYSIDKNLVFLNNTDKPIYPNCKKVIATTTELLYSAEKDFWGEQYERKYALPRPSNSFIEKFIKEYNQGNIIDEIFVEMNNLYVKGNYINKCSICKNIFHNTDKLGFVCQDCGWVLKVAPDNTITIKPVQEEEKKYTKGQLIDILCEMARGVVTEELILMDDNDVRIWFNKDRKSVV